MLSKRRLFHRAAKSTLEEYFQFTSLNGFGLLYSIRRRKYQRLFWFMFILLGFSFASYVVLYTLLDFFNEPTVTTLGSEDYGIANTPYPAVSICSVNKLSRKAVAEYANSLAYQAIKGTKHDYDYWLKKMELFAGYFELDEVDFQKAVAFQNELLQIYENQFNIADTMERLAPKCEDLLIACFWLESQTDCRSLFQLYKTPEGFCCIFNYQHTLKDTSDGILYPNGTGVEMGLTILLNTTAYDYFYTNRNFHGYIVQIFDPTDMPDGSIGGVEELYVTPGVDVKIEFSVMTQISTADIRDYSVERRHCYLLNEYVGGYGIALSESKCLSKCKIQNIQRLCECLPYYTPLEFLQTQNASVYCTLKDLQCLKRFNIQLNTYRPTTNEIPKSLSNELQNSIDCSHCLPSCSYDKYYTRKLGMNLIHTRLLPENRKYLKNITQMMIEKNEFSLIKLYFPKPYATQYTKSVLYNWYQILSNIGGVIGISMGCSFISGFEIIYFLGFRLWENLYKIYKKR